MALDEVLLSSAANAVLLRLYTWVEPTVSFGYFEPLQAANRVARGRTTVRRWTGGGMVEHGEDSTYSLCVPRSCAFAGLRSADSYRRIHASVARALHRCGMPVESSGGLAASPDSLRENACFKRPVLHDLLVGGRKVAGGAQRRSRAGLLHQGSVLVRSRDAGVSANWRERLRLELPFALADFCEERPLTPEEIARADALASGKYATAAWASRF